MADTYHASGSRPKGALPAVDPADRNRLMTDLLRGVSRSFYLTLRVLPKRVRGPVGLAYLLARAADTIADTRLLPPQERLKHLLTFRAQVEGPASGEELEDIGLALTHKQAVPEERALLTSLPEMFSMLEASSEGDRARARSIVVTLTRGMEMDLATFPTEDSGQIVALKDPEQLDRYVYLVAGCVGEFWTSVTMAHTPGLAYWDQTHMSEVGIRFGKALQLTNILRDVPRDLRIARCYLPESLLAGAGLTPIELLDPAAGARARPVLAWGIETALEHYCAAEEYLLATPHRCHRLRLAALWPILIGLATLAKLARNEEWLDPTKRTKVTRAWVYRTTALSVPCVSSDWALRSWIRRLRGSVESAL